MSVGVWKVTGLGEVSLLLATCCALAGTGGCNADGAGKHDRASEPGTGDGTNTHDGGRDGAVRPNDFGNTTNPPMGIDADAETFLPDAGKPIEHVDGGDCGSVVLKPRVDVVLEPGTVLVVFDNSGSMTSLWNGEVKWKAAAFALRDAISPLSDNLSIGAILFPTDSSCAVDPIDSGDQIPFLPGGAFLIAWNRFLMTNSPSGGTPLGPALQAADAAFASVPPMGGDLHVIVLTDGAPNCDTTAISTLPAQWFADGVKTHVVGLPGSSSAETLLNDVADKGGTGTYLTPSDGKALRNQLAKIIGETVVSALKSCTIPLDPAAPNPDDVHLVVTEDGKRLDAGRDLGKGGGWTINGKGTQITLEGVLCDKALAGDYDRISIEYGCVDLPPLPPPKAPI